MRTSGKGHRTEKLGEKGQLACQALQQDLQFIYDWADKVNMTFNSDKFESLRFWPGKTPQPTFSYTAPDRFNREGFLKNSERKPFSLCRPSPL